MDKLTDKLLFILSIIITVIIIDMIPIRNTERKTIDYSKPSCKDCKKVLNDFCSSKYCNTKNCTIDPRCRKSIQYTCSTEMYECDENTCRDFDKYNNDKTWDCYGMF